MTTTKKPTAIQRQVIEHHHREFLAKERAKRREKQRLKNQSKPSDGLWFHVVISALLGAVAAVMIMAGVGGGV